jgi:tetratricopeptide (TPR) repeat protein
LAKPEQSHSGGAVRGIFAPLGTFELDEQSVLREMCDAALEGDPDYVPALMALAESCTRSGEHERGLALDVRLSRLAPGNPVVWYNLGCSHSLLGDMERSLEALRRALTLGYDDLEFMLKDPDLAAVRRTREFKVLLDAFRSRAAGGSEARGTAPSGA